MSDRPPKPHLLQLRADDAFISVVDEWRRHQPDIPTRSEAIRRLVLLAVAASPKKG